jgi:hypothetical protein
MRYYRKFIARASELSPIELYYYRFESQAALELIDKHGKSHRTWKEEVLARATRNNSLRALDKLTDVVDGRRIIVPAPPLIVRVDDVIAAAESDAVGKFMDRYRQSLPLEPRMLIDRFSLVDIAKKVVGVGSVGTRCLIVLLEAGDGTPLFLQFKQAAPSVLEAHLGPSAFEQAGQRVVEGQRLIQATSDVLLGWARRSGKASRKSNLVAKCIGPEHTTNGAPTAGGLRDRDHSRDRLPRTYLALTGALAPASTPVTRALRPLLERMISFSISIARKNTRPPANRIGHTCNGTASLPKSLCRGPK